MNTPFEQCGHGLVLSDRHKSFALPLPGPVYYDPVDEVSCSLQLGHPGRHMAIVQAGGMDGEFRANWLHWSDQDTGVSSVTPDTWCGREGRSWREEDAGDDEPIACRMPHDHGGAHAWQIEWFYRELSDDLGDVVDRYEAEHGRSPIEDRRWGPVPRRLRYLL